MGTGRHHFKPVGPGLGPPGIWGSALAWDLVWAQALEATGTAQAA